MNARKVLKKEDLGDLSRKDKRKAIRVSQDLFEDTTTGLMMRNRTKYLQIFVPPSLRIEVMDALHKCLGHQGSNAMYARMLRNWYWVGMNKDCKNYVRACYPRADRHRTVIAEDQGNVTLQGPASVWNMDIVDILGKNVVDEMGPRPRYLLLFHNNDSGYPEAHPMVYATTEEVADGFLGDIVDRWGASDKLRSDLGQNLISKLMREVTTSLNIVQSPTSSYHPQADPAERAVYTTVLALRKLEANGQNWERYYKHALANIRFQINPITTYSCHYLMTGWDALLPIEQALGGWNSRAC